ncbi:hypothetical protein HanIR_Chr06g0272661 [Helianthus annuus]|nr:hypothetical protein HanIR_Chr06g0272661 [Helianthus annuus]
MFLNPDRSGRDPETRAGRSACLSRFNIGPVVGPAAGRSGRRVMASGSGRSKMFLEVFPGKNGGFNVFGES